MSERRILMIGPVDLSIDSAPNVHFYNLAKEFTELGCKVFCSIYAPERKSEKPAEGKFEILLYLSGNP